MTIFTVKFWQYAGERAIKTVAQTATAIFTVAGVSGVLDVMWSQVISASLLAGIISILTSIVAVSPATPGQGE
jgi:hypothetical protein